MGDSFVTTYFLSFSLFVCLFVFLVKIFSSQMIKITIYHVSKLEKLRGSAVCKVRLSPISCLRTLSRRRAYNERNV